MKNDKPWKNNSNGNSLQYDFVPPAHWTSERIQREQFGLASLIEAVNCPVISPVPGWLQLANNLPMEIRMALVAELRAGNRLVGIGSSSWPNEGSIVVNMVERFKVASRQSPTEVVWRELNDPHYCREELSQVVGGVAFIIIA